jgi:hypothetical protein
MLIKRVGEDKGRQEKEKRERKEEDGKKVSPDGLTRRLVA